MLLTPKAEAQKVIEDANGKSQATLINAKAEAEAIRLKSDALKQNPELVQLTLAERWDGKLPAVTGGSTPLLDLRNMGGK
jgi:regulator of protease activity HflC (stomatin/prohibitin superfamily)